jgi:hypothetical protein
MATKTLWCAAVMLAFACEKKAADIKADEHTWWCWPETVCHQNREACEIAARAAAVGEPCIARRTAYCKSGCATPAGGSTVDCERRCAINRATCELLANDARPCIATPPPARPELLFEYTQPGWYCFSFRGSAGVVVSSCVKYREQCEQLLAQLRPTAPVLADVTCERAAARPFCFSYMLDGLRVFNCTIELQACKAQRAEGQAVHSVGTTPDGHVVGELGDCAPFPYD